MGRKLQTTGPPSCVWIQGRLGASGLRAAGLPVPWREEGGGNLLPSSWRWLSQVKEGRKWKCPPPQKKHPAALGPKFLASRFGPKEESIPHASHSKRRLSAPRDFCHKPIDITSSTLLSFPGGEEGERPEEADVMRTRNTHNSLSPSPPSKQRLRALDIKRCSPRSELRRSCSKSHI